MTDSFANVKRLIEEIAAASPKSKDELEQFRIQYLGSKNVIKPLMGEIRNVPNEQKKEYGQLINEAKETAERKFADMQEALESASSDVDLDQLDLTRPGEPLELGSRHPIATTMNRIVGIFQRMGFAIAEGPDIEDDWHNFTALNFPPKHPARECCSNVRSNRRRRRRLAPSRAARSSTGISRCRRRACRSM